MIGRDRRRNHWRMAFLSSPVNLLRTPLGRPGPGRSLVKEVALPFLSPFYGSLLCGTGDARKASHAIRFLRVRASLSERLAAAGGGNDAKIARRSTQGHETANSGPRPARPAAVSQRAVRPALCLDPERP